MRSSPPERSVSTTPSVELDERARFLSACYEQHGAALFRLAHILCESPQVASLAVVTAFDLVSDRYPFMDARAFDRRSLARLTYLACVDLQPVSDDLPLRERAATPPNAVRSAFGEMARVPRALLALTLHGGHTYAEAARLLHLDPAEAAAVLRETLRDTADRARHNGTTIG